jgi:TonB family protein
MPDPEGNSESTLPVPDRRAHVRRRALPLAYVDLGENNGGIVLNISAGGLAIAAVEVIHEEHLPRMRFQLPQTNVRVEATGHIAWTGESKKAAGVRFVDLSAEAATQINDWLTANASELEAPPRREEVHTTARRPFSSLMAPEQGTPAPESAAPIAIEEKQTTALVPGSSFTAALQKTRASAATLFPVQSVEAMQAPFGTQAGQIFSAARDTSAPERRWWALTALVSLFAVISFVAGMAAGGGGWEGVLRLIGGKSTGESKPVQVGNAGDGTTQQGTSAPIADGAAKPGSEMPSSRPRDSEAAPPDSPATRSSLQPATPTSTGRTAPKDNSPLLLKLPDSPISASASVAITSRRSIQVVPEAASPTSQQGQNVQIGQLFYRVEPFYPPDAERQGIEGTVEVHASVGRDGKIKSAEIVSGPRQLTEAAVNAIREWRYKPTLFNGQPIESEVDVKMTFRLPPR